MAFWGVEVKPGKPYTLLSGTGANATRLRLTQATIGNGTSMNRSVLQCNVGNQSPVLLCSLLPEKMECCSMELEFDEKRDVIFSVVGPRSVHLAGFFPFPGRISLNSDGDETESYGEDIADTESESLGRYNSEEDKYESDFIDDSDIEEIRPSPKLDSTDDEKPVRTSKYRRLKKKYQLSESDCKKPSNWGSSYPRSRKSRLGTCGGDGLGSEHLTAAKHNQSQILESEDEETFLNSFFIGGRPGKAEGNVISDRMVEIKRGENDGVEGRAFKRAMSNEPKQRKEKHKLAKSSNQLQEKIHDDHENVTASVSLDNFVETTKDSLSKSNKKKRTKEKTSHDVGHLHPESLEKNVADKIQSAKDGTVLLEDVKLAKHKDETDGTMSVPELPAKKNLNVSEDACPENINSESKKKKKKKKQKGLSIPDLPNNQDLDDSIDASPDNIQNESKKMKKGRFHVNKSRMSKENDLVMSAGEQEESVVGMMAEPNDESQLLQTKASSIGLARDGLAVSMPDKDATVNHGHVELGSALSEEKQPPEPEENTCIRLALRGQPVANGNADNDIDLSVVHESKKRRKKRKVHGEAWVVAT